MGVVQPFAPHVDYVYLEDHLQLSDRLSGVMRIARYFFS